MENYRKTKKIKTTMFTNQVWIRELIMCGKGINTHIARPKKVPLIK